MQLRDDWERFQRVDLGVVAIGQASAARSKQFQQQLALQFPLLSDPRRVAYAAYGLTRIRVAHEASLTALGRGIRATIAHGVSRSPDQDMLQLGGVFVVGTDGIVRCARPQQRMSDMASVDELLAAI